MATIRVCDRCNREIYGEYRHISHPDFSSDRDMCEDCFKEFQKWFAKPYQKFSKDSHILPGWTCTKCGAFNGEAKENRLSCRSCEANYDGAR